MNNTIRIFIRTINAEESRQAKEIFKQLGGNDENFISSRCRGWVYMDDKGKIKFIMDDNKISPHDYSNNHNYQVYYIDNFPQEIIDNYKINMVKKLVTQPIVTKKEYRNAIEILKEVMDNIKGGENWYIHMCYEAVIEDLIKLLHK